MRAYLGHLRLDTPEQVAALNDLYDQLWTYYNLFQPVLRLAEKTIVDGRLRRAWDTAQTPYQRLVATDLLTVDQQARLHALHRQTNPLCLRDDIYRALRQVWRAPLPLPDDLAAD